MIVEGRVDFLILFWDPLEPQPHDPDVKALLRMAVVWNVPVACDRSTADFMISSPLMHGPYDRLVPDYDDYINRNVASAKRAAKGGGSAAAPVAPPVAAPAAKS
jgi:methylglyoxal synthase